MSRVIRHDQEQQSIELYPFPDVSPGGLGRGGNESAEPIPAVIPENDRGQFHIHDYRLIDLDQPEQPDERYRLDHQNRPGAPGAEASMQTELEPDETRWEAERIGVLQAAQIEAAGVLTQARVEAAALKEAARVIGREEAETAVSQEMTAQFANVLASVKHAAEELVQARIGALRQAEEEIIALALHLARRIVQCQIRCDPDVIASTLSRAMAYLVDQAQVVIRVHPDDLARVKTLQPALCRKAQIGTSGLVLAFEGDTLVERGGCVIESAFGTIDARIETQFEELEQRLCDQIALKWETQ